MPDRILHIKRYMERFELPKNYGSCEYSLQFFRYFVDPPPNHTDAKYYLRQIERVQQRYEDHLAIECIFYRLVAWASTYRRGYRGFVFAYRSEPGAPASLPDIALSCGLTPDKCQEYIDCLIEADLIEWMDMADCERMVAQEIIAAGGVLLQNALPSRPPPEGTAPPSRPDRAPTAVGPRPDRGQQHSTENREQRTENIGPNGLSTEKQKNGPTDQRTNGEPGNAQGSGPANRPTAKAEKATETGNGKPAAPPGPMGNRPDAATGSPIRPTKSDAGSGQRRANARPLSRGGCSSGKRSIVKAHWKCGKMIFCALKMGLPDGSSAAKDEIGSFARFFADNGRRPDMLEIALKEAHALADKRCRNKSPRYRARVWWKIMKGKVAKGDESK